MNTLKEAAGRPAGADPIGPYEFGEKEEKLLKAGTLPIMVDRNFLEICRAGMARQIAALDACKRVRVEEACKALGLSEEATFSVLATTCDLIDFEQRVRYEVLTTAQRYEALAYVQDLAEALAGAMAALPFDERVALHLAFRESQSAPLDAESAESEPPAMPEMVGIQALAVAANEVLAQRTNDEGKGGRRKTLDVHSRFVQGLADTVEKLGFSVGRGGEFERFCGVIFDVAGVRATPEGAIRNLSNRKKP
jgi:hypothetical protein